MLLLKIMLGIEIASLISNYLQYTLLHNPLLTEELADANDIRQQIIAILYSGCFIATMVNFLQWFRRACYNLGQIDEYLSYQQKDTGIVWFIPILNVYKPYQMMKELYKKTKEHLDDNEIQSNSLSRIITLNSWWALWMLSNILGNVSFRLSIKSDTIEELRSLTELDMIINIISVPLTLLAIRVIHNYAQTEPLLEKIASQQIIPITDQTDGD